MSKKTSLNTLFKIYKFLLINRLKKILTKKNLMKKVLMRNKLSMVIMSWECITENNYQIASHTAMVMKNHFAPLTFVLCTSNATLRPSWLSVHTSQRPVRSSQMPLSVRSSQMSLCSSQLSLSPYKIKYRCAVLKYWCAVLKTSTAKFFSIALHVYEIFTAHFWSTTLCTSKVPHCVLLKYHCRFLKFLPRFSGHYNYLKIWINFVLTGDRN